MTQTPPSFTDNLQQYRQLVETWCQVTNVPREKQGGVLLISLQDKPLQICLSISKNIIASTSGVEAILSTLEKVYEDLSGSSSYKLFSSLANIVRESGERLRAFIQRFDTHLDKMSNANFNIPDEVLTYQFLKGCGLSDANKQLISVSCDPLTYGAVKDAAVRLYSTGSVDIKTQSNEQQFIKHEPESTMFQSSQDVRTETVNTVPTPQIQYSQRFQTTPQNPYVQNISPVNYQFEQPSQNVFYQNQNPVRMTYQSSRPPYSKQQVERLSDPMNWKCSQCSFHNNFSYRSNCFQCNKLRDDFDMVGEQRGPRPIPQQQYAQPQQQVVRPQQQYAQPQQQFVRPQRQYAQPQQRTSYQQTQRFSHPRQQNFAQARAPALYSQNYNQYYPQHQFQQHPQQQMSQAGPQYADQSEIYYQSSDVSEISNLMRETINHGLLDCGAAKTVAGSLWYDIYLQSLSDTDRKKVTTIQSSSKFKFGDGETVESKYSAVIPCTLGKKELLIAVEIVESEIPLLLSSETMKRLKINLNFEFDTITIFGENHPVGVTSTGHYVIPLNVRDVQVTLLSLQDMMLNQDPIKSAKKLHQNFSHGDSSKIIKLMRQAGFDQKAIEEELIKCESTCQICLKVKRAKPRPRVCLPLADTFNGCISIDLKMIKPATCQSFWILHITDVFTRFSMGIVIADKSSKTVLNGIFKWIGIFGRPGRMMSDNGKEFDNKDMRELCSTCNISILMTAVEAQWSNGICEKGNAAIGELTVKIINDVGCTPEVGVNWAVNARNTLVNVYGYSPQQLVLGKNSSIQSDEVNLPSLNQTAVSKYVSENLNAIAVARSEFQKKESAVRLQRAFRTRTQYSQGFTMGDLVYYRRDNRKEWLGPAKVIGAGSGVVWIDHGRIVKIHPCKVRLCQEVDQDLNDRPCTQNLTDETTTQTEIRTPQQEEDINIPTLQLRVPPVYQDYDEDFACDTSQTNQCTLQEYDEQTHSQLRHLLEQSKTTVIEDLSLLQEEEKTTSEDEDSIKILDEDDYTTPDPSYSNTATQNDDSETGSDINLRLRNVMFEGDDDDMGFILPGLRHTPTKDEGTNHTSTPIISVNEPTEEIDIVKIADEPSEDDKSNPEDNETMLSAIQDTSSLSNVSPEEQTTVRDMIMAGKLPGGFLQTLQNTIKGSFSFAKDHHASPEEVRRAFSFSSTNAESSGNISTETSVKEDHHDIILLEVPSKRYHESEVKEAMMKELQQFKDYDVYETVQDTGQPRISTRWVVTERTSTETNQKTTKARLVCRGFEESTNEQLDSPTVDKISIRFLFSVCASNRWKCESLDVKGAFLQAENLEREVFVEPPTGLSSGRIWRLKKPMYGLKDASRKWFLTLRNELKNLGCEQSTIDLCMFTYHVDGKLCGMFVTHVDDFLVAGNDIFKKNVIEVIKQTFHISKHELDMFAYVGLEVHQTEQGISISQRKYLSSVTPVEFNDTKRGRALSESEITQYRGLLGKLSWLVTQTRPDYKVAVLEASVKTKHTVEDMKNLNRILAMMNMKPGYSLSIINLGHLEKLSISVYSDAAFHLNGMAKEGYLIFLTDGTLCNILTWTSKRVKGTVIHSFDAEMIALVSAIKEAIFINEMITETVKLTKSLPVIIHTDCNSLRNKLYAKNCVENSRTNRKLLNWIHDRIEAGDISMFEWIPRSEQIADALTKEKSSMLHKMNSAIIDNIHPWTWAS